MNPATNIRERPTLICPITMRETFKTRFGSLMALVGLAIGLGDIWRFPYMAGLFGGGAFLVLYLVITALIGIPAIMAELALGRYARQGPARAFTAIGMPGGRWVGALICLTIVMASGFYLVVIGWSLYYLGATATKSYFGVDTQAYFDGHFGGFRWSSLWTAMLVALLLGLAVARGVRQGIEKLNAILVPIMFVCFVPMIARSLTLPGAVDGLRFFLVPDFFKLLQPQVALAALGQAFFSLTLGGHALVMYGSYLADEENLPMTAAKTAFGDTLAGVLAGFVIFPAVFAYGLNPQGGPGLSFVTLPRVFSEMPLGQAMGMLFFLVAFLAGFTSLLGCFEICHDACHQYWGWSRRRSLPLTAALIVLMSVPSLHSATVLQINDLIWGTTMFPFGSLMAVVGLGWCVARGRALAEVRKNSSVPVPDFWLTWIRYVIPTFILLVLIYGWWDYFHSGRP